MLEIPTAGHILSGNWGDTAWEFHAAKEIPPTIGPCLAATCVVMRSSEVVLTQNNSNKPERRGNWELLGGHLDPLDPADPHSLLESPEEAVCREAEEEGGVVLRRPLHLFGYRSIVNAIPKIRGDATYPQKSHMAYYFGEVEAMLEAPTDPEQPAAASFRPSVLEALHKVGHFTRDELTITIVGLRAAAAYREGNV